MDNKLGRLYMDLSLNLESSLNFKLVAVALTYVDKDSNN